MPHFLCGKDTSSYFIETALSIKKFCGVETFFLAEKTVAVEKDVNVEIL